MNQTTDTPKFRPVLTYQELEQVISSLSKDITANPELISRLRIYLMKAELGGVTPAYKLVPPPSHDKYGYAQDAPERNTLHGNIPDTPINRKRLALYKLWEKNPAAIIGAELEGVNQYRYDAGLMFPEEMEEYKKKLEQAFASITQG
jgi:hypothetical protein